jgi:hypothetical protein
MSMQVTLLTKPLLLLKVIWIFAEVEPQGADMQHPS